MAKSAREEFLEGRRWDISLGGISNQQSIYKYVSLSGRQSWNYFERTINDFELVGSTIGSLNDPFEGNSRILNDLTRAKIEDCLRLFDVDGNILDLREANKKIPQDSEIAVQIEKSVNSMLNDVRILSFCSRSDSPLLWSHYANSHRGACIHFSTGAFVSTDLIKGLVSYERSRPVVPLSLPASIYFAAGMGQHPEDRLRLRAEMFKKCFFTKPSDWSYEEEARILYFSSNSTNISFEPSGLFEIIVGANTSDDDFNRIINIVKQSKVDVGIRRAFIDTDTFSVGIRQL